MLKVKVEDRISIKDALNHPWFHKKTLENELIKRSESLFEENPWVNKEKFEQELIQK